MKSITSGTGIRKSAALALVAMGVWIGLAYLVLWPLLIQLDETNWIQSALTHFAGAFWWIMLLWALHHLGFQIASLYHRTIPHITTSSTPEVAILYTTRDDFNPNCCRSCLEQDYPHFRVLVCDDSASDEYRTLTREFCSEYPDRSKLIRRSGDSGYKAGNLNNAIESEVNENWVLLVDADQELPLDYLRRIMSFAPTPDSPIGFVQGAQESVVDQHSSYLQEAMSPGATLYCQRDLPLRNAFGFVPMLGHGTLISTEQLRSCGGFPEVVSEDYAFAMRAAQRGLRGRYVQHVVSRESFPHDFPAFVIRLKKYSSGTAELFRVAFPAFFFRNKNTSIVEKWDLLLTLGWYSLLPIVTANGFVAAIACHRYWAQGTPILAPVLPYLFIWLTLTSFAISMSASDQLSRALRFYFWSTGIFASVLPLASWAFVKHLVSKPKFERTPKNRQFEVLAWKDSRVTQIFGICAVIVAVVWYSPFSFVLAGQGVAYLSFPLYAHLCHDSRLGRLARLAILLPGLMFLLAVGAVWYWAYL